MILFHYTDVEGAARIAETGMILPFPQELLGGRPAIWLTDLAHVDRCTVKARRALGVDHDRYQYDRTEVEIPLHVRLQDHQVHLWSSVAFDHPGAWAITEAPLGARPDTWWLGFEPIKLPTERGVIPL